MTVHRRAHPQIRNGRLAWRPDARAWMAEDFDLLEQLCADRVPPKEMTRYFTDPPVSAAAVLHALKRGGMPCPTSRGRVPKAERARLDALYAAWLERQT